MYELFLLLIITGLCRGNVVEYKYSSCKHLSSPASTAYKSVYAFSMLDCVRQCSHDVHCSSAEFDEPSKICKMFTDAVCDNTSGTNARRLYIKIKTTCLNNGTLDTASHTCKCYEGYIGDACERIMMDCTEGYASGHYDNDDFGIYWIKPILAPAVFQVECSMNQTGGATYMLKNSIWLDNSTTNASKSWENYQNFFGIFKQNHWIGLQNIYYITSSRPHNMFIQVFSDIDYKGAYRKYEHFKVDDELTNYTMTYSGSYPWNRTDAAADPDWIGDAGNVTLGDSMKGLNGSAFSTYDRDNDLVAGRNCALDYKGGWWYNACADCNPNGPVTNPRNASAVDEAFWKYDFLENYIMHIEIVLKAII